MEETHVCNVLVIHGRLDWYLIKHAIFSRMPDRPSAQRFIQSLQRFRASQIDNDTEEASCQFAYNVTGRVLVRGKHGDWGEECLAEKTKQTVRSSKAELNVALMIRAFSKICQRLTHKYALKILGEKKLRERKEIEII